MNITRINQPQKANLDQALTIVQLEGALSSERMHTAALKSLINSVKMLLEDGDVDAALELLE